MPWFPRIAAFVSISMLALAVFLLVSPGRQARAVGMTFTVNQPENAVTQGDGTCDATCTLRDAILAANANAGNDTIVFTPAGGDNIIYPGALPLINAADGITIDGSGADVVIAGFESTAEEGLVFYTSVGTLLHDVTVQNLTVSYFNRGIEVCSGRSGPNCTYDLDGVTFSNVTITNTGPSALRVEGAKLENVEFDGGNIVDGLMPGNGAIWIEGASTVTNVSVTDSTITQITSHGVTISGSGDAEQVTVTGNTVSTVGAIGISVGASGFADDIVIANNSLNDTGYDALNVSTIASLSNVSITNNTISGGGFNGIAVQGGSLAGTALSDLAIEDNTVQDSGANGSPDSFSGYGIVLTAGNTEGESSISRNTSSQNRKDGILINGSSALVSRNRTFQNQDLGIDLLAPGDTPPGVTFNDAGDGDSLYDNPLLNFPLLVSDDGQFVHGTACPGCTIELFLSDNDVSSYGEGQQFLKEAIADGDGDFSISVCDETLLAGTKLTATATDAGGNTSEFSLNRALTVPSGECPATPTPSPPPTPTATSTHTATPTPTPTPSGTAGPELTQGDVDCNGTVTSVDSLKELRYVAQLSVSQTQPCPVIGTDVASFWGDVDCSGSVTSVDALKILRYVAALPVAQTEPCPDIGTPEG